MSARPIHPQVQALIGVEDDEPRGGFDPATTALEALRAGYVQTAIELGGALEPVDRIEDAVIPSLDGSLSIPARVVWPQHVEPGALLLWFHGGGWVIGDLPGIERVCRSLANAAGAVVVAVDYRLAPEHPFPAAADDAEAALRWAAGEPYGPLPVVVGGDSAGGNLAAVAARRARGLAALQVLVHPVCDGGCDHPSYAEFDDERTLSRAAMQACFDAYAPGGAALHPDVSPLRADDLAGLPPALVITAGHDVLRDEAEAYAARLRDAGVDVELHRYEDMVHGFLRWGGVVDRAREAIGVIATRVMTITPESRR